MARHSLCSQHGGAHLAVRRQPGWRAITRTSEAGSPDSARHSFAPCSPWAGWRFYIRLPGLRPARGAQNSRWRPRSPVRTLDHKDVRGWEPGFCSHSFAPCSPWAGWRLLPSPSRPQACARSSKLTLATTISCTDARSQGRQRLGARILLAQFRSVFTLGRLAPSTFAFPASGLRAELKTHPGDHDLLYGRSITRTSEAGSPDSARTVSLRAHPGPAGAFYLRLSGLRPARGAQNSPWRPRSAGMAFGPSCLSRPWAEVETSGASNAGCP